MACKLTPMHEMVRKVVSIGPRIGVTGEKPLGVRPSRRRALSSPQACLSPAGPEEDYPSILWCDSGDYSRGKACLRSPESCNASSRGGRQKPPANAEG